MSLEEFASTVVRIATEWGSKVGPFVEKLEGPYKWYVISGVILVLTALISRFIFKTIKWFVIILLLLILIGGGIWFIAGWAGLY